MRQLLTEQETISYKSMVAYDLALLQCCHPDDKEKQALINETRTMILPILKPHIIDDNDMELVERIFKRLEYHGMAVPEKVAFIS